MKTLHVALLALALAAPSPVALAKDKGGKGKADKAHKADKGKGHKDKDKGKDKADRGRDDDRVVVTDVGRPGRRVVIADADRRAARDWWRSSYGRDCPPGLAKKDNGCLPPGQAKKRYERGRPLPGGVVIKSIPTGLRLGDAPAGYRYVYVDGDVLLIDTASRVVADVIENVLD